MTTSLEHADYIVAQETDGAEVSDHGTRGEKPSQPQPGKPARIASHVASVGPAEGSITGD